MSSDLDRCKRCKLYFPKGSLDKDKRCPKCRHLAVMDVMNHAR